MFSVENAARFQRLQMAQDTTLYPDRVEPTPALQT